MAVSKKQLFTPVQIGASAAALYTYPSTKPGNAVLEGLTIRLTNTDASNPHNVTLYHVPSGDTAAADTQCGYVSIVATDYADIQVPSLIAGDAIHAEADAATQVTATFLNATEYT